MPGKKQWQINSKKKKLKHTSIKLNPINNMDVNSFKEKFSSHIEYSFHFWRNAYKSHVFLSQEMLNKGSLILPVEIIQKQLEKHLC